MFYLCRKFYNKINTQKLYVYCLKLYLIKKIQNVSASSDRRHQLIKYEQKIVQLYSVEMKKRICI